MEKNGSQITRPTTLLPSIKSSNEPTVCRSGPVATSLNNNRYNNVTVQRNRHGSPSSYTCTVNSDSREEETKEFPMYIAMADLCITPTGFTDTKLRVIEI